MIQVLDTRQDVNCDKKYLFLHNFLIFSSQFRQDVNWSSLMCQDVILELVKYKHISWAFMLSILPISISCQTS